jgi:pentapeptide MXKDX repeat protein
LTRLLRRLVGIRARWQRLPPSLFNFIAVQLTRLLSPVFPEFSGSRIRNAASYDGLPMLIDQSCPMKRLLIASALSLLCSTAFAQNTTGPAPQSDNMDKPGMNNTDKAGMKNGSMGKETTGTNNSTSKNGMSKDGMK